MTPELNTLLIQWIEKEFEKDCAGFLFQWIAYNGLALIKSEYTILRLEEINKQFGDEWEASVLNGPLKEAHTRFPNLLKTKEEYIFNQIEKLIK